MTAKQAWLVLLAATVGLEHHLKRHHNGEMLTHAVRRSRAAQAAVLLTALHLLDTRGRLRRWDPISWLGRWV